MARGDEGKGKRRKAAKLQRSETTSVRFDPKLRYLMEIAARVQRRSVSSFIDWAVETSLSSVFISDHDSLKSVAERLWDVDRVDRLAKLGCYYPHLLNHDEQLIWKIVREKRDLWLLTIESGTLDPIPDIGNFDSLDIQTLRTHFEKFEGVASGQLSPKVLESISTDPPAGTKKRVFVRGVLSD